jgi:hypothetical protein
LHSLSPHATAGTNRQLSGSDEEMNHVFPHRNSKLAVILFATALTILWENAAMAMTLNSPAFQQNGHTPSKYTCEGEDVSPPLAWEGVPNGAKSLVLIIDDPDAPALEQTSQISFSVRLPMSIASCAEQTPAISHCRRRLSTNWRLISKLPKPWASYLEEIPDIAGFRLYVIWDNGEMSKDLSQQKLVLSTSRRHGESTRARVDIVLEGYKGGTGNDPLEVSVHSQRINGETQDSTYKLPVGYFTENRMFRSIIVTHYCLPFEVNAKLAQSHKTLNVEPWCGD